MLNKKNPGFPGIIPLCKRVKECRTHSRLNKLPTRQLIDFGTAEIIEHDGDGVTFHAE